MELHNVSAVLDVAIRGIVVGGVAAFILQHISVSTIMLLLVIIVAAILLWQYIRGQYVTSNIDDCNRNTPITANQLLTQLRNEHNNSGGPKADN